MALTPPAPPGRVRAWMARLLRWTCRTLLVLGALAAVAAGLIYARYRGIVDAGPPRLATAHAPGEQGRRVLPFLGTGGYPWVCGHNFPGSMVPFGMVRLGPETRSIFRGERALNTSGYFYADPEILGFSHTRLNGTGATDGGHFLITPLNRTPASGPRPRVAEPLPALPFSHADETASPGYYAVRLPKPGVLVELTATARVGVHRYTFDPGTPPQLAIDVMNALGGRRSREGSVRVRPDLGEIEGSTKTFGTFAQRYGGLRVHFVARTEPPFTTFATWNDQDLASGRAEAQGDRVGVNLGFAPAPTTQSTGSTPIILKLAISHVSIANARANLEAEVGAADFDTVASRTRQLWEDRLSTIAIEGGSDRQRAIFATALYRVFQMPTVFNDVHGDYLGFDAQVHRVTDGRYFTDLSLWDTFRTTHPLYTLIAPQDQRDMVRSLVLMLEQGGWLPRWPAGAGYSNSMLGTPADIVIAEAYLKGIREFDVDRAFEGMKTTALGPTPPGAAFSGRQGIEHYLAHRYCPRGLVRQSVSRTFEYGWADDAIARLADALGRTNDAALFREHSRYYRNLWNPGTQYFQPRDKDGRFYDGFQPRLLTYLDRTGERTRDYVEGSALQWRWGAPYDAEGMVALFRSRDEFVRELDAFFAQSNPARGDWNPGPFYWHGNQPDIHAAYLFNAAGRPDLTRRWVRWILEHKYGTGHDGLDGNDDGGTLSAWYVLSALGLYPVAGSDRYELGIPLFPRAEVNLGANRLVILAENFAPTRIGVREIRLNEIRLDRTWIRHAEIAQGGTLRFVLEDEEVGEGKKTDSGLRGRRPSDARR